tara:strand:- start:260 stop:475 length:216 start_codon:yes stop_codon:yes gene_type:complete
MMKFIFMNGASIAANSIKSVAIKELDFDAYELSMPEGDMNIAAPLKEIFETFEEAARWAEATVGISFKFED